MNRVRAIEAMELVMKSTLIHMDVIVRNIVVSLFLLAGIQAPLLANQMWEEMFNDNLENAKAGEVEAQYEVGIMYLKGQGVDQDRGKALYWLKKSSDGGNQQATSKLSRIQEQQEKFDELLGEAESGDIKAQYEVAMMYLKGRGVDQDGKKARQWLGKAADKGDAKAITRLGIINYKGEGGSSDYQQALKQFKRVGGESTLAQYYLGEMYASGSGVKRDYHTAIDWYKKAADGGFDRAQGKIINLKEEIRIQELRQQNVAQARKQKQEAKAEAKQAAAAAAAKPVVVASAAKASPKKPVEKKREPKPVKLTVLDKLASEKWQRGKKPVEYLPSKVTECDQEKGNLVCFSKVLTRDSGTQTVEYRVKSIVKSGKDSFTVVYRNLVLDVTDSQEPEDQPLGYGDEVEKGFKIKTGWTQEHTVSCEQPSSKGLRCIKDQAHKMTLVAGN
jgi:TPR repeat protein